MTARVYILGCGTSGGVPQLLSGWGNCDPNEPKNARRRCSILVEYQERKLLVDTTPDCRLQLLDFDLSQIDGLLYTHSHADHCHGLDEMRWVCQARKNGIATYGFATHLEDLQHRFSYAFSPLRQGATAYYKPVLLPHILRPMQSFHALGLEILPLELHHGFSKVLGFRIGNFAYCTDVVELDETNLTALEGIDYWIIDCLRYKPHPTHSHLERTLAWIERLKPKQAFFTHMNNDMDYQELVRILPQGVAPAFDGLQFDFSPD